MINNPLGTPLLSVVYRKTFRPLDFCSHRVLNRDNYISSLPIGFL